MRKRGYDDGLRPLVIELGVFFDCKATNSFLRFWQGEAKEVVDFMLSLVNAMQVRTKERSDFDNFKIE